jgi:GST-like protein
MIDYFGYITTMSWRASIALEELELEYRFSSVNIGAGEQFKPEHTARNPQQKVPVIIDRERAEFLTWFFWIVSSYGDALSYPGATFHTDPKYRLFDKTDYGQATYERFTNASVQAHAKLDERLAGRDFICGDYSIIDIAAIGSTVPLLLHGVEDLSQFPNLERWYHSVRSRPAVVRGLALGDEARSNLPDYYAAALFDDRWSA